MGAVGAVGAAPQPKPVLNAVVVAEEVSEHVALKPVKVVQLALQESEQMSAVTVLPPHESLA